MGYLWKHFQKNEKKSKIDLKNKKCGSILNAIQTITGFLC
jgi:hypothetical protein